MYACMYVCIYVYIYIYIYTYIYIYILKRHYKEIEKSLLHKGMMVKKYQYLKALTLAS